jgi:hypothetical protein
MYMMSGDKVNWKRIAKGATILVSLFDPTDTYGWSGKWRVGIFQKYYSTGVRVLVNGIVGEYCYVKVFFNDDDTVAKLMEA